MLPSFLPSFPVCGPVVYVTPTSLQRRLMRGRKTKTKPFRNDYLASSPMFSSTFFSHMFILTLSPSLSPSSHLAPLSLYPFPSIPFPSSPILISQERMKPLPSTGNWMAWMETTITDSRFSLESHSFSSPQFFWGDLLCPLGTYWHLLWIESSPKIR